MSRSKPSASVASIKAEALRRVALMRKAERFFASLGDEFEEDSAREELTSLEQGVALLIKNRELTHTPVPPPSDSSASQGAEAK